MKNIVEGFNKRAASDINILNKGRKLLNKVKNAPKSFKPPGGSVKPPKADTSLSRHALNNLKRTTVGTMSKSEWIKTMGLA